MSKHGGRLLAVGRRACRRLLLPLLACCVGILLVVCVATASAAPIWNVESQALPTVFRTSDGPTSDQYRIEIENLGSASDGLITVVDRLPPGVSTRSTPVEAEAPGEGYAHSQWTCSDGAGQTVVTCTSPVAVAPATAPYNVTDPQKTSSAVQPILIPVTLVAGASEVSAPSRVTVSGGGAIEPGGSANTNPINSTEGMSFGYAYFNFRAYGPTGETLSKRAAIRGR